MLQMAMAMALEVDVAMTMTVALEVAVVVNIKEETVKRQKFQVTLRRRSIVELTWPRVVQIVLRLASISEHTSLFSSIIL